MLALLFAYYLGLPVLSMCLCLIVVLLLHFITLVHARWVLSCCFGCLLFKLFDVTLLVQVYCVGNFH